MIKTGLQAIRNFFPGQKLSDGAKPPVTPLPDYESLWLKSLLGGVQSASGVHVTPLKALGIATVYSCVRILSNTIATVPLNIYRIDRSSQQRSVAFDHYLYPILHDAPNRWMTSSDLRLAVQHNLSLRNRAIAIINRTSSGRVDSIVPVLNEDFQAIKMSADGDLIYKIRGETYFQNEVLDLKTSTYDGINCHDLVRVVNDVIGLAIALEDNASKFFKNGSRPIGTYSHPGSLSDKAYDRLKTELKDKHEGVHNAYKIMLLEEGLKYEAVRSENRDSQFDESRERQDRAISRIFGVPPHKLAINSNMPRANVEQENISFVVDTLRPLAVIWEQNLNKQLLSPAERAQGYYIKFNLNGLLRGDLESRFRSYSLGRQWGWLSTNEIRDLEDMNPIGPEGDIFLQPLNMINAANGSNQEQE